MSNQSVKKLLLLIHVEAQDHLLPVVESEGWHTVKDLFKKTGTSYNQHWNGKYVLDQDEIPWKVTDAELTELKELRGQVVVLSDGKYFISDEIPLYQDKDGSTYAMETDLEPLLT
ncbi:MAG: hypothetical protein AB1733_10505 [Thermodesulfobacteriota bacterium]